jgi:uncharacterized protein (TIGR03000 family)
MRLRAAVLLAAVPGTAHAWPHRADYPPPPPDWHYHDLPGGPYLTTDYPFQGWPGYRGAYANLLPLGGHRPAVPVYAPLPCVEPNPDPVHHPNKSRLGFGIGYYGWVGPYRASPRHLPYSVSVWPAPTGPGVVAAAPVADGGCLTVRVSVPAAAELLVDGVKTAQTGADRLFESPPGEPGREVRYELTARWVENGAPVERTRTVTGKAGEAVRVDFVTEGPAVPAPAAAARR